LAAALGGAFRLAAALGDAFRLAAALGGAFRLAAALGGAFRLAATLGGAFRLAATLGVDRRFVPDLLARDIDRRCLTMGSPSERPLRAGAPAQTDRPETIADGVGAVKMTVENWH